MLPPKLLFLVFGGWGGGCLRGVILVLFNLTICNKCPMNIYRYNFLTFKAFNENIEIQTSISHMHLYIAYIRIAINRNLQAQNLLDNIGTWTCQCCLQILVNWPRLLIVQRVLYQYLHDNFVAFSCHFKKDNSFSMYASTSFFTSCCNKICEQESKFIK